MTQCFLEPQAILKFFNERYIRPQIAPVGRKKLQYQYFFVVMTLYSSVKDPDQFNYTSPDPDLSKK
jgi:hypothetical protein